MKTKKVVVKVDSNVQQVIISSKSFARLFLSCVTRNYLQENVRNVRRGLKTLQPTDIDKENLAGRPAVLKDLKSG